MPEPTEQDVEALAAWVNSHGGALLPEDAAEFLTSDWSAEHDRRVKAEALREVAHALGPHPKKLGWIERESADFIGNERVDLWLRARADRIEAGEHDGE